MKYESWLLKNFDIEIKSIICRISHYLFSVALVLHLITFFSFINFLSSGLHIRYLSKAKKITYILVNICFRRKRLIFEKQFYIQYKNTKRYENKKKSFQIKFIKIFWWNQNERNSKEKKNITNIHIYPWSFWFQNPKKCKFKKYFSLTFSHHPVRKFWWNFWKFFKKIFWCVIILDKFRSNFNDILKVFTKNLKNFVVFLISSNIPVLPRFYNNCLVISLE